MPIQARFAHANIVASDWRRLARFYERVFGCRPVPPERDLRGEWLERGTGVADVTLRGVHLRLPGLGDGGPTLEIFEYEPGLDAPEPRPNRRGLGHLAFAVDDVPEALRELTAAGGRALGEVATTQVPGAGRLTFTYARDPEGNVIELQCWR
jgi:catechol 2,3-dioxygenase-like lactoylglutathione lyase family enzyme